MASMPSFGNSGELTNSAGQIEAILKKELPGALERSKKKVALGYEHHFNELAAKNVDNGLTGPALKSIETSRKACQNAVVMLDNLIRSIVTQQVANARTTALGN